MLLAVCDGMVIFPTYLIHINEQDRQRILSNRDYRLHLKLEGEGIVCYSLEELSNIEKELQSIGVPYKVEKLSPDPDLIAKTRGVKYSSRSEAIAHLLEDKEPESLRLPNLVKKLQQTEAELLNTKQELAAHKARLDAVERKLGGKVI